MKILHIFDDYGTPGERALAGEGSVPTVVYYLAKYAAEKGHDVTILERDFGTLPKEEEIDGIRYIRINADKLPAAPYKLIRSPAGLMRLFSDSVSMALKIDRFLKKEDFDVIHVHFPFAACILVNVNRKVREKMVYTAHIGDEGKRLGVVKEAPFILKIFSPDIHLISRVGRVTVMHEGLKSKLISNFKIDPDRIFVIPHGIDIESLDKARQKIENEEKDKERITILSATRIVPEKGIHILMKSIDLLVNKIGYKKIVTILTGDTSHNPNYFKEIEKFVHSRKLEDHVKFLGDIKYEELLKLYHKSDIFVYPLISEGGVSIAILEALAAAKPVIATNIGGLSTQVKDGWNGFLVEPRNEVQLAEKLRYLIDNEEEREKMGRNSRKLAEDEFDWSKITDKYLEVYWSLRK